MSQKIDIWLDCDPGLDDILAIVYAAYAKEINIIGISTSPGNSTLQNTTRNTLDILYHIGRSDIQVYAGSNQLINGVMRYAEHVHGQNGLGNVFLKPSPQKAISNSFQQIYHKIMDNKNKIIWTNTGSLTNLCILLLTYPDVKSKIKEIVLMGGAIGKGNTTPAAEFNIFFDPQALDNVLRFKDNIPLVMIPLEVTHMNIATKEVYERFEKYEKIPFGKAIYSMLLHYKQSSIQHNKLPYPPYHDPLTIFYILHPEEFEVQQAKIQVDLFPKSYGRTNIYFSYPNSKLETSSNFVTTNLLNHQTKFWDEMISKFEIIFSQEKQKQIGILYE